MDASAIIEFRHVKDLNDEEGILYLEQLKG